MTARFSIGDRSLTTSFLVVAIVGAALAAVGAVLYGLEAGLSVAIGAGAALANLYALTRIVGFVTVPRPDARPEGAAALRVLAVGKSVGLFGGLGFLLFRHLILPIPMVVGYGALPIGIAIAAVLSDKAA